MDMELAKTNWLEISNQISADDAKRRRQENEEISILFAEAQQRATPNTRPLNWTRFFTS